MLILSLSLPAYAITYNYDRSGRLTSVSYDFGLKVNLSYDPGTSRVTVPPYVYGTDPVNGAVYVPVDQNVYITFSEDVQPGDNYTGIVMKTGGTVVTAAYSLNNSLLTINPVDNLDSSTTYAVYIPAGAVKDLSGNNSVSEYTLTFTTQSLLSVVYTDPANGAADVPVDKTVYVTFNKDIQPGPNSGDIAVKAGETVISTAYSVYGSVLTIDPAQNLNNSTAYAVYIPVGAVKDAAGNGLAADYSFGFTTQAALTTVYLSSSGWSDGSVGTWDSSIKTGTLTKDLTDTTIVINGDDITLDGNRKTLTGTTGTGNGVVITAKSGDIIKNLTVKGFTNGIHVQGASDNTIQNNTLDGNQYGIYLLGSSGTTLENGNRILDNTVTNSTFNGIHIQGSSYNTVDHNTSDSNRGNGIHLQGAGTNQITYNTVTSNTGNGIWMQAAAGNTLESNTVETNVYGINMLASNNNIIQNNRILDSAWEGVKMYNSDSNRVLGGEISGSANGNGVQIQNCSNNNTISGSGITENAGCGIRIFGSAGGNTMTGNTIEANHAHGICITNNSGGNTISGNTINGNIMDGVNLTALAGSNTITGNTVSASGGSGFNIAGNSGANTITGNTVKNSAGWGLYLWCGDNTVIGNNFVNNINNGKQACTWFTNTFNDAAGGNYWSDWITPDADGDGIVDQPYIFKGGQDNKPRTSEIPPS
ncbi:MAG: right-handed parallel beta-helix repeat-containing protein [Bacillota bacterium]